MKIYLASTAPGNEKNLFIKKRLLSYHHISSKILEAHNVFNNIKKVIKNENKCK